MRTIEPAIPGTLVGAFARATPHERVRPRVASHLGIEPALFLEAPRAGVTAIALPASGGRIVHYGIGDENIFWNPEAEGKPLPSGGYQCDVGPEMRLIPPHPVLWSEPHAWRLADETSVSLASAPDPVLGLTLERDITMDADTGALSIMQRLRNVTEGTKHYCLWDRTLCRSGGFTLIPLNARSRFPAGWVLGKRAGGAWLYDGTTPAHENVKVMDGVLVCRSRGAEQKVGADSDAGWIGYARGRLLFVKYYPYDPQGRYTDGGLSVAHYYNEALAEMEPISPEVSLGMGEQYEFPERWTIVRLPEEVTTPEQARALVASIPPSG